MDCGYEPKVTKTWTDFKNFAKENGFRCEDDYVTGLVYDGIVYLFENGEIEVDGNIIAKERSPWQMWNFLSSLILKDEEWEKYKKYG